MCEVMLLGQNVNSYGKNLEQPVTFAELLREVNKIEGLKRIRFMTSHPKDLSDDLILAMKECDKVCKHMHLPLQSGSSRILKIMNRHYDKEQYLTIVKKLREAIPDIALTTDIIVGFPGETEEDFQETLDVVRKEGEVYGTYSLSQPQTVKIKNSKGKTTNVLVIRDGKADMKEADCPDKLCVHQKAISAENESIVCLPNRVVVTVTNSKKEGMDGFAQ